MTVKTNAGFPPKPDHMGHEWRQGKLQADFHPFLSGTSHLCCPVLEATIPADLSENWQGRDARMMNDWAGLGPTATVKSHYEQRRFPGGYNAPLNKNPATFSFYFRSVSVQHHVFGVFGPSSLHISFEMCPCGFRTSLNPQSFWVP